MSARAVLGNGAMLSIKTARDLFSPAATFFPPLAFACAVVLTSRVVVAAEPHSSAREADARVCGLSIERATDDSDSLAADFQTSAPRGDFLRAALESAPSKRMPTSPAFLCSDPAKLKQTTAADAHACFIGESAGSGHATLGIASGVAGKIASKNPALIFPGDSRQIERRGSETEKNSRDVCAGLRGEDLVDHGKSSGVANLDFFLISDGARNGHYTFYTDRTANPDATEHVLPLASKDSPYLFLGIEDRCGSGGNRDFSDLLEAIDVRKTDAHALATAPEPATWLTLGSFLAAVFWMKKRFQYRA